MELPQNLRYTKTHEWVRLEDGEAVIGITDHAQNLLGDIVFVELPEVESQVQAGNECAVVESVKAAADIYSPVNGEVIAINEALADSPDTVNHDPYQDGWLFKVKLDDPDDLDQLLDAVSYNSNIEES